MTHVRNTRKFISLAVVVLFLITTSGCAMLKPDQYEQYGYHGTAQVKVGHRVVPIDWIGNLFGIFEKLIIWNWKMERHNIQPETKKAINDYIADNQEVLGDVYVQVNRYAPQDAWRRLVHNKGVKWPYRLFIGTFIVLIIDTILVGRIFGGDRYNPFTHTLDIYSDIPAVALHELGHARDFSERRYRGSYAILRLIPFADLYQEYKATNHAFEYVREKKMVNQEIENYKVLYPAYGTYVGSYLFIMGGSIIGAIVGHILGRTEAHHLEERVAKTTPSP